MLTINQLMKYLRTKHHIAVKSNQAKDLRNMGYYHGFKGYRFIRVQNQRISFTSLDEIIALNTFISLTNELCNQLPANVCNQILGTQQRPHLKQLQDFISNS